jgi:hypothetical protein
MSATNTNTNTNNTPWNLQHREERWYNTIIPTIPSSLLLRTGLCQAWSGRVATVCRYSTHCNKSRTKCCLYLHKRPENSETEPQYGTFVVLRVVTTKITVLVLGCDTMYLSRQEPTFWRNLSPLSSGYKNFSRT